MNGTVFYIGVTTCGFTMATIVEHHPQNVIGTFWLPSTEKDYNKLTVKLLTMMGKNDAWNNQN